MKYLHCPFCLWSRLEDRSKGAPEFDYAEAVREFTDHVLVVHWIAWRDLYAVVQPRTEALR